MENVLQEINRRYISLKDEEVRRNNQILESVLSLFIERMKSIDPLFKAMYRRVFYGGSYYDGLRVGKPEEFDLDLLLDIPRYAEPVLIESNIPGFVHLQLKKFDAWMKQPEAQPAYKNFRKLFDEKFFLSTVKTLEWMESIVQRSLNGFSMNGFEIKFRKGGPALTLHVFGPGMKMMDVDLVTCFVFSGNKWPVHGFRSNPFPSTKPEFFIVPKKPKAPENQPIPRYWRLSFQEQERVLIDNKGTVKPTIKLLKKLRDSLQHTSIASYYIKTVLLHLIDQKEISFWRQPLSQVFMTVLKEYCDFIKSGRIPYYWNKKNNLIGKVNGNTLQNINGRLTAVIKDIENNPDKPDTVAKYLLTTDELRDFTTRAGTPVIFQQVSPSPQEQQSSCIIV